MKAIITVSEENPLAGCKDIFIDTEQIEKRVNEVNERIAKEGSDAKI